MNDSTLVAAAWFEQASDYRPGISDLNRSFVAGDFGGVLVGYNPGGVSRDPKLVPV